MMVTPGAGRGMTYEFDCVFPPAARTHAVYEAMGTSIVQAAFEGYNGTIFAYGQTASVRCFLFLPGFPAACWRPSAWIVRDCVHVLQGKTHTLIGSEEEPGLTTLAVQDLFQRIHQADGKGSGRSSAPGAFSWLSHVVFFCLEFLVRVSYVELYNEDIRDLLDPSPSPERKLTISDDPTQGPYVRGAREYVVNDAKAVLSLMAAGEKNRCPCCRV
jgi:centromeric protein E